jgi:transposase
MTRPYSEDLRERAVARFEAGETIRSIGKAFNSPPSNRGKRQASQALRLWRRQSGRWTGRAFIRGGRANVRQAAYMPALVATRFNPDMKAKYKQMINAGKPAKVALTAVMRKLILLANALLKANRTWAPKPA